MQAKSWHQALAQTRRTAIGRLASLLGTSELDSQFWEELEATLIQADFGVKTATELLNDLRQTATRDGYTKATQLYGRLRTLLVQLLEPEGSAIALAEPHIILIVGVNGSGKTTAVARLARWWQLQGKRILLAAADTYRPAAVEQLTAWGHRLDVEVIAGRQGSDPGALVYEACQAALTRGTEIVIADTSGRMHTKHNLMAELQKVHRVTGKVIEGAPHEVLLVLDATTGQNGLSQAQAFTKAVPVTGIILAKLDSSARGGVALSVKRELGLPIKFVGLGEGIEDLAPFDPAQFVEGLLAPT